MSKEPISTTLRVHDLTLLLEDVQQTLAAIRRGEVDALVVSREGGDPRVFMLEGEDAAHRSLLETLNEGAATIAGDGTILHANRRLAELLGAGLDGLRGASLAGFLGPGGAATLAELTAEARGGVKREASLVPADGEPVPVMLSMRAVGSEPPTYTAVLTDLSALKAAERALRRANDELEARVLARTAELERVNRALRAEIAERTRLAEELRGAVEELEAENRRKDEFLSMLGHELRNPLAPIATAAQALRMLPGADPLVERSRAVIERQVTNLGRIVDDLLDVSRITQRKITLRRRPVELGAVVASAVEAVRPAIEASRHELEVRLPEAPVSLVVDPTRFEQILVNLLHNAAKYTDPGGRVALAAEVDGDHVVVRVRDTGVGIAPELLPHVFDLFVQGKRSLARSQGGLGVGLTLVKNLVDMHGGAVEARSEGPGRGTEVSVRLPLAPPGHDVQAPAPGPGAADRPSAPPSSRARPPAHERRVLIVEDNPDVAEGMVDLLDLWGYRARAVANGEEGVGAAEAWRPHAVIVDVGLPGIDGFEVARRLRAIPVLGERLLLIGASGYGQEKDRARGKEAGFDHYLVKPMNMDLVHELLDAHCGAG